MHRVTAWRASAGLILAAFVVDPAQGQSITRDPEHVRIELGDVHRLAQVLQSAEYGATSDTAALLDRDYLADGSPGLRSYAAHTGLTAASLAAALRAHPTAYADLDALAAAVLRQEPALRAAFHRLVEVFPGAAFPPIWIVAGHHGAGGLAQPQGVLIAVERLAGDPERLVPLVMHELAHFQQAMVQGVEVYRRIYGPEQTLLALALREGSAELIAELTAGQHTNPRAERYGSAHERQLWTAFQRDMRNREPGDWMFVRPTSSAWPPDLGYWIGYRIARSYYDRAPEKRQAIAAILSLTNFEAFLEASAYAKRMATHAAPP